MAHFTPIEDNEENAQVKGSDKTDMKNPEEIQGSSLSVEPKTGPGRRRNSHNNDVVEQEKAEDPIVRLATILTAALERSNTGNKAGSDDRKVTSDPVVLAEQFKSQFKAEDHINETDRPVFICIGGQYQDWGYHDSNGVIVTPPYRTMNGGIKPIEFTNPESRPVNNGQRADAGPEVSFHSTFIPQYKSEADYIRNHVLFGIKFFERSTHGSLTSDINLMENIYDAYSKVMKMNDQAVLDNARVFGIEGQSIDMVKRKLIIEMARTHVGIKGNEAAENIITRLFNPGGQSSEFSAGIDGNGKMPKGGNNANWGSGVHTIGRIRS